MARTLCEPFIREPDILAKWLAHLFSGFDGRRSGADPGFQCDAPRERQVFADPVTFSLFVGRDDVRAANPGLPALAGRALPRIESLAVQSRAGTV